MRHQHKKKKKLEYQYERGFNLYFSGANRELANETNKKLKEIRSQGKSRPTRRGWSKPVKGRADEIHDSPKNKIFDEGPTKVERKSNKWKERKRRKSQKAQKFDKTQGLEVESEEKVLNKKYTINLEDRRNDMKMKKKQKNIQKFGDTLDLQKSILGLHLQDKQKLRDSIANLKFRDLSNIKEESKNEKSRGEIIKGRRLKTNESNISGRSEDPELQFIWKAIYAKRNDDMFIKQIQNLIQNSQKSENSIFSKFDDESQYNENEIPVPKMSLNIKSSDFGPSIENAKSDGNLMKIKKPNFRISKEIENSFKDENFSLRKSNQSKGFKLRLKPEDSVNLKSGMKSNRSKKSKILRKSKNEQKFESQLFSPKKKPEKIEEERPSNNLNLNFEMDTFDEKKLKIDEIEEEFEPESVKEPPINSTKKSKIDSILDNIEIPAQKHKEPIFDIEDTDLQSNSTAKLRKSKGVLDDILTGDLNDNEFDFDDIEQEHNIVIRVKGAHNTGREVGLTELKIYDKNQKEIILKETNASIRGVRGASLKPIFNDNFLTNEKCDMMLLDFPILADFIDLNLRYKGSYPALIRIWNYNNDPGKGVKQCDIIVNGIKTHSIELKKASGETDDHYQHDIPVKEGIDLELFKLPKIEKKEVSEVQESRIKLVVKPPSRRSNRRLISGVKKKKIENEIDSDLRKISDSLISEKSTLLNQKEDLTFKDLFKESVVEPKDVRLGSKMGSRRGNSRRNISNVKIGFKKKSNVEEVNLEFERGKQAIVENSMNKLRIPKPKAKNTTSISKEFDSILKNQRIDIEESIVFDQKLENEKKSSFDKNPYIGDENFKDPAKKITPLERFNQNKKKFNFDEDEGDILDFEFNTTLKNLQKFNKMNLSRMGTSNLDDIFQQNPQKENTVETLKKTKQKKNLSFTELKKEFPSSFRMPIMPSGKKLEINIYSTWGDKFYVGLSGIEIFDRRGKPVNISKDMIQASPPDLNILPDFEGDPRTVDKLFDGVYRTCDEIHSWLSPFYEGSLNKIFIDFQIEKKISMIRIWNYNKNRIHNSRGAKEISMFLDDELIFIGEVSQAPGQLKNSEENCEYLIFCNENVFPLIEKFDWINQGFEDEKSENDFLMKSNIERPSTSNKNQFKMPKNVAEISDLKDIRNVIKGNQEILKNLKMKNSKKKSNSGPSSYIECSKLAFQVLETWGDEHYSGLTGIKFFDENNKEILLTNSCISANPRDLRAEGNQFDQRILENLLNDVNLTTNDMNMWLVSFSRHQEGANLFVNFGQEVKVSGMRIWNYNKSEVDSTRGIKRMSVTADIKLISANDGVFLRKAPGRADLDFSQFIRFPIDQKKKKNNFQYKLNPVKFDQFCYPPNLPSGFNLRIHILSTWGDSHYIGLNGLEIFDKKGNPCMAKSTVTADPLDLSVCGNIGDVRKIQNLKNGVNNSSEDKNIWLSPYINPKIKGDSNYGREMNQIFIEFGESVCISCIKFWNYTKGVLRGVKDFEIYFDDSLLFSGELTLPDKSGGGNVTSIIFTGNGMICQKLGARPYFKVEGQPMAYSNEGNDFGHDKRMKYQYENLERPGTGIRNYTY